MKPYFEQHEKTLNVQLLVILLVELAQQRGVHADKILKGTKLFSQDLSRANVLLSHAQVARLIENTCKYLPQADVPFLIGSRVFPQYLGNVGQALFHSPNIETMLRISKLFHHVLFPFQFMKSVRTQDHQYLIFNPAMSMENTTYRRFMNELLVSFLMSIAKQRGILLNQIEVRFPYQKPQHIEQYQVYLPCKYHFLAPAKEMFAPLQIKFSQSLLKKPFEQSNKILTHHSIKKIQGRQTKTSFLQFVMQLVYRRVATQKEVSLEWLAAHLVMSPATLKRKLSAHGISFQQLHDMMRQQQAVFLLTEQGLNNEKVASRLNFSDITNFRRSFKRWTGMTPSNFQQTLARVEVNLD